MNVRNVALASVALWVLAGCAISPEKVGRIDDKPVVDAKSAGLLAYSSAKAFPNQIVTRWAYSVKEINGKPFPRDKSFVQLEPGEYEVKIQCGSRFSVQDTGWIQDVHTSTLKVEAGKRYWAWIGARQISYKRNGNLIETTGGECWTNGFNGNNPFFDVGG